ncbi:MAG: 4Fe-4S dicluster domain-containing protein [Candidatus Bathyarchaeia archaeon]
MPLKTLKIEGRETLTLQWILHLKNFKLTLDRKLCVGCEICSLACPKEAVKLEKQPKTSDGKAQHAKVDVNLEKCNFCGICDILCPYGAIKVTLNGEHVLSVVEKESFPKLVRDIQADAARCPIGCVECEKVCPLNIIKVRWLNSEGKLVQDVGSLTEEKREGLKVFVDIKKDQCPCCRICEFKCPEGVLHVRKAFYGKIRINPEMCPDGCRDCLDVCPITGALYVSEGGGKVYANESFCVYCGACKIVCPVSGALELKRTKIRHTTVRSGAWNKTLERLTSPLEMTKELKAKGSFKAMDSVEKRFGRRAA